MLCGGWYDPPLDLAYLRPFSSPWYSSFFELSQGRLNSEGFPLASPHPAILPLSSPAVFLLGCTTFFWKPALTDHSWLYSLSIWALRDFIGTANFVLVATIMHTVLEYGGVRHPCYVRITNFSRTETLFPVPLISHTLSPSGTELKPTVR